MGEILLVIFVTRMANYHSHYHTWQITKLLQLPVKGWGPVSEIWHQVIQAILPLYLLIKELECSLKSSRQVVQTLWIE